MAKLQRLLQNKAGLGHRAFKSVHQQQYAVYHFENAFHLAAEVGMSRRVDDIDLDVLIGDGGVLGQDGDAAFAFQISVIHHTVRDDLVFTEGAALFKHFINKGGLAMVDVGDDGYVA